MKSFFIFAGEPSGDLHGSHLIQALKERFCDCLITAVAGPRMRENQIEVLLPMEDFEVMGFTDVLASLPSLWKSFYFVRNYILKQNFDAVILIDYPGFNLRLAKALRKQGFEGKIIQYVCPSVWAHGRGRIRHLAETVDLLLTIYPFEADCFADTGLPVVYVGNPLKEYLNKQKTDPLWREKVGLSPDENFVAIFPGSREGEIIRNLNVHLQAAQSLRQDNPSLRFAVSCAHPKFKDVIARALASTTLLLDKDIVIVPKAFSLEMMTDCTTAIAKSGTVTLELALRERPTVVTYLLTPLNKFIAKYVLRVDLKHYCIVNILGKEQVFPEFIESRLPLSQISDALRRLHIEGAQRAICMSQCRAVSARLGEQASSHSAAQAIEGLF